MQELDTYQLMEQLMRKPKDEVEYVILHLMLNPDKSRRIDSHRILDLYMKSIEIRNMDMKDRLTESNSCILDLLLNFKKETENNSKSIHRALHDLNESRQFNMKSLNEKYRYDRERDKNLSWYEREKKYNEFGFDYDD